MAHDGDTPEPDARFRPPDEQATGAVRPDPTAPAFPVTPAPAGTPPVPGAPTPAAPATPALGAPAPGTPASPSGRWDAPIPYPDITAPAPTTGLGPEWGTTSTPVPGPQLPSTPLPGAQDPSTTPVPGPPPAAFPPPGTSQPTPSQYGRPTQAGTQPPGAGNPPAGPNPYAYGSLTVPSPKKKPVGLRVAVAVLVILVAIIVIAIINATNTPTSSPTPSYPWPSHTPSSSSGSFATPNTNPSRPATVQDADPTVFLDPDGEYSSMYEPGALQAAFDQIVTDVGSSQVTWLGFDDTDVNVNIYSPSEGRYIRYELSKYDEASQYTNEASLFEQPQETLAFDLTDLDGDFLAKMATYAMWQTVDKYNTLDYYSAPMVAIYKVPPAQDKLVAIVSPTVTSQGRDVWMNMDGTILTNLGYTYE